MASWANGAERDLRVRGHLIRAVQGVAPKFLRARKDDPATGAPHIMRGFNPPADVLAQSIYVPRGDGTNLRLLVLRRKGKTHDATGVLWLHGGGYATGMPEMVYMGMAPLMLEERPCVVVVPDYRLSLEMPFPGALEDAHQALVWLQAHASELGIRANQLFVGGESAGGGLTAALCLYERDLMRAGQGGVSIACQMPLYPMLDDRPTPSSTNNSAPVWDSSLNRQAWDQYLAGMDRSNVIPYAAPARETDYTELPPAITFVGTLEPFLDETVAYVSALQNAGIHTDFRVYRGCYHAFDLLGESEKRGEARAFFLRYFSRACDEYYS